MVETYTISFSDSEEFHFPIIFNVEMVKITQYRQWMLILMLAFAFEISAQFPQGPPSQALGQQGVTFEGVIAVPINPAGLASQKGWQAMISSERPFLLSELQTIYAATSYSTSSLGTFGMIIQRQGFDQYNELLFGISYARKLSSGLSIGLSMDYMQTMIEDYGSDGALILDIGMQWQVLESLKAGFATFNPFQIRYSNEAEIPSTFDLGLEYAVSDRIALYTALHKTLHVPEDFRVGLRYLLHDHLSFNLGVQTREQRIAGGIDLKLSDKIVIHASTSLHNTLGVSPGLALIYQQIN